MKTADALEFLDGWAEIMDLDARAATLTVARSGGLEEAYQAAHEVGLIAFKTASAARRLTELFDRVEADSEDEAREFQEFRAATVILRQAAAKVARNLRGA